MLGSLDHWGVCCRSAEMWTATRAMTVPAGPSTQLPTGPTRTAMGCVIPSVRLGSSTPQCSAFCGADWTDPCWTARDISFQEVSGNVSYQATWNFAGTTPSPNTWAPCNNLEECGEGFATSRRSGADRWAKWTGEEHSAAVRPWN